MYPNEREDRWWCVSVEELRAIASKLALTNKQSTLFRVLLGRSERIARIYVGAIIALNDELDPERFCKAAHQMRELMEKISEIADVEIRALNERMGEKVDALHHVLRSQGHDLTDTKLARHEHRAVYAGAILVHTNNGLHHFRISLGCVWVKINHDTSLIPHSDPEGCPAVPFTKHQCPAHPSVFLKRLSPVCFDHNVWSKSAKVNVSARFALDAMHCAEADYRNTGFVEDAMIEIHQFDITPIRLESSSRSSSLRSSYSSPSGVQTCVGSSSAVLLSSLNGL
jgi:hypothetical protein